MAKKKRYTIRLYRMHDLDLITFMETHKFNIIKAIYSCVVSFSKKEYFVIDIPPRSVEEMLELKRRYDKTLSLDYEKDKDAIKLLDKIQDGYRNNFLKMLLRLYLCNPMSEEFLKDKENVSYFYEMFSIFRDGKRVAKAGKISKNIVQNRQKISKDNENEMKTKTDQSIREIKDITKTEEKKIKERYVENSVSKNNEKFDFDTINEDEFIQDDEQEISENNAEEITDMFSQLI